MERFLDLFRAARLAGVRPADLRQHIHAGDLILIKGKIQLSQLLDLYPEIELKKSSMVEVVDQIRDDAMLKAARRGKEPQTMEELLHELEKMKRELNYYREKCQCYKQYISDMRGMLTGIQDKLERRHAVLIENVLVWVRQKMK